MGREKEIIIFTIELNSESEENLEKVKNKIIKKVTDVVDNTKIFFLKRDGYDVSKHLSIDIQSDK